jgi:hypothetical protein
VVPSVARRIEPDRALPAWVKERLVAPTHEQRMLADCSARMADVDFDNQWPLNDNIAASAPVHPARQFFYNPH